MKNKSIDLVNEKTERKELLEWIPMLVKNKLNSLTTAQLRIIHYILGYESREINTEALMEEFEGYGYSEEQALEIAKILKNYDDSIKANLLEMSSVRIWQWLL